MKNKYLNLDGILGLLFPAFAGMAFISLLVVPHGYAGIVLPSEVSEERMATEILWRGIEDLPVGERPAIILVLGGGGARGLSHIGVLRVFEDERIPVDQIVGVSVGALIGSLYAGGVAVDNIELMAAEVGWKNLTDFSKFSPLKLVLSDELYSSRKMESYLTAHMGHLTFSKLKIPFSCVATDLKTGERVVFNKGPVAIAARASATIPGMFEPVQYKGRSLVDGGLLDNLPVDVAKGSPGSVIVGVLPKGDPAQLKGSKLLMTLVRSMEIQRDFIIEQNKEKTDFLIEPDVGSISMVDLGRSKECVEAGTLAARESALALKHLIIERTVQAHEQALEAR